uniref:Proteinase inhibitor I4 serpin n=1 Tax=Streptomyces sp. NBC_00049 TaxID=2903617 RepID=A0AAU2K2D1_9ACTN
MRNSTVRAVNRLTSDWAAQAPAGENGTVFTAAGVWPLLALLADGAGGPARDELAQALGIPAESAAAAARELLAGLDRVRGLGTATGLWTKAELPLEERWSAQLPAGVRGTLTGVAEVDRKALDAWASEQTGGLIERMPAECDQDTLLVLASALTLKLKWLQPFHEVPGRIHEGPWADRHLRLLARTTSLLDRVRVAHGPAGAVTLLEVVGDTGVDVHLALGEPDAPAGATLSTAIAAVTRAVPSTDGYVLPEGEPGPGLRVHTIAALSPAPVLNVETVTFEVRAEHRLLEHAALFGLETASDTSRRHFPGISSTPLAVNSARQSAMALFGAEGFEAAAVTQFGMAVGSAPVRLRYRARRIGVRFDRPFGFLAVHRTSRLVLAAGWVTDPAVFVEEDEDDYDDF